jgi:hypothetical protein
MGTRALHTRPGADEERREHIRYDFLERVYLLVGANCDAGVSREEIEEQFGHIGTDPLMLVSELASLGYLRLTEHPQVVCLTRQGIEYLQRDAWRRRTIRMPAP